jgi:hypothetical protein
VSFEQVRQVGKKLNFMLKLKGVSHTQIASYFTDERKDEYSIREVVEKLKNYPF